ncbi:unnamed protein product [Mytilus edulis]|uniref:EGF-like domain-containing protein n=1 Tax=Mytilus edulis TaxID=6550 RepID=A0A8S3SG18_MYTED|nr:unnamed protein product [Mytilus edulis]
MWLIQNNVFFLYCIDLVCPKIAHCNHRRCKTPADNHCEYCEGEVKDMSFWRAYTPYPLSTRKTCEKACSWRSDSTRCFPGNCTDDLASNCNCWHGFSGHHCENIIADVNTSYAEAKLRDTDTNKIITTPIDPNQPGPQPIRWTNHVNWKEIDIEISFKFPDLGKPPDYDPKGEQHFVIDFKYGVVHASMQLKHYKEKAKPKEWKNKTVPINGKVHSIDYIFQWDLIKPYHPCSVENSSCVEPPVKSYNDVTDSVSK